MTGRPWERIDERCWLRRLADGSYLVLTGSDRWPRRWSWWHRGPEYDEGIAGSRVQAAGIGRRSLEDARDEADQHVAAHGQPGPGNGGEQPHFPSVAARPGSPSTPEAAHPRKDPDMTGSPEEQMAEAVMVEVRRQGAAAEPQVNVIVDALIEHTRNLERQITDPFAMRGHLMEHIDEYVRAAPPEVQLDLAVGLIGGMALRLAGVRPLTAADAP